MNQIERTKRNEKLAKERGLVKVHPLVPKTKVKEVLAYCKAARDDYFKLDKGNDDV